MKTILELFEPSNDAIDYNYGEKKNIFVRSFYSTTHLDILKRNNCFYIIGEKGSGKTALALYYQLNSPDGAAGKLLSIDATQYKKFIRLKQKNRLEYSDYASIWRTTLLMLMSQFILQKDKKWIHKITKKFVKIELAIKKYDEKSLLPEIDTAVGFASTFEEEAGLAIDKVGRYGIKQKESFSESSSKIRFHLLESEKSLKDGLGDIKLSNDIVIFLDGLDSRPTDIGIVEFRACLQGLLDAIWQLNTQYFLNISDTKGRMRICVLIRPDIFDNLDIPNSNSKVNDNSVVLDWDTSEEIFANSTLFDVIDKYFYSQNDGTKSTGWNYYFPYKDTDGKSEAFIEIFRNTFLRPRDFFTAIKILLRNYRKERSDEKVFHRNEFKDPRFTKEFADYLLGEMKNHANYYMTNSDFLEYLTFFQYLNGNQNFSYSEYLVAFTKFTKYISTKKVENRRIYEDPDVLLQFFYSINAIGYYDHPVDGSKPFIHWSFRERTINNLCPKIKSESDYVVFNGIKKAVDIGKRFQGINEKRVKGKIYRKRR